MRIQVFGPGCRRCHQALEAVQRAAAELGLAAEVEYVTDLREIMAAGVISTPAVAVDGDVKVWGRVPTVEDVKKMLREGS